MIKLIKNTVKDLLWNEQRARTWARATLLWAATAGAQMVAYPPEVVATWGLRDWAIRFAIAGAAGLAGLVAAGQRNPSDEQIAAAVDRVKAPPTP